jgi:very-short-patch-repair endonuclease
MKRNKIKCEKCGGQVSRSNYLRHLNCCNGIEKQQFEKLEKCPYCNKDIFDISGGNHIRWCEKNPNRGLTHTGGGWNKGLNKDNSKSIYKQAESLKKCYNEGNFKFNFSHQKRNPLSEKHKLKIKNYQLNKVLSGTHKGWSHINLDKNRRSYPEKWFIENILEKYDLFSKYTIKEKMSIGKYFFDFAFLELNLDLEIDGNQHYLDKGIKHDIKRDEYSKSKGWKVYRISWKKIKQNNWNEINEFLKMVL